MNNKLLTLLITSAMTLSAATFHVSTTSEFRTALNTAATNGEDNIIVLTDGIYKTTDDGNGTFNYNGNTTNKLTLEGSSSKNVILSGDHVNQIFNHNSTEHASMTLEKLSFEDGNNTSGNGGGVYTDYSIRVKDCNFTNNSANGSGGGFYAYFASVSNSLFQNNISIGKNVPNGGGGFKTYSTTYNTPTIVNNSQFINNTAGNEGGGFASVPNYLSSKAIIKNSLFKENKAMNGGGFTSNASSIENSIFEANSAMIGGGFTTSNTTVTNSIFKNNIASYEGATLSSRHFTASNILVISDFGGSIFLDKGNDNYIYNSIFLTVATSIKIPSYASDTSVTVKNNYIDESSIDATSVNVNNIHGTLGFVDEVSGDYNLTSSSDLIDAGTTSVGGLTLPATDLNGNARIAGANIDIGPYEFSTTKPTINSFTYTGTAKELSQLTFSVAYNLTDSRTLDNISYDYTNTGNWTTTNTHTYDIAGTYTARVKVTDSEGEYTIRTLSIKITKATLKDKLLAHLTQSNVDAILPIIEADKTTAINTAHASGVTTGENNVALDPNSYGLHTQAEITTAISDTNSTAYKAGKSYVQANPSEFSLVTQTTYNTAIIDMNTTAIATGIATGKSYVQANPSKFSLVTQSAYTTAVTTATATGRDTVLASPSTYGLVSSSDLNSSVSEAIANGITQGKQYVQDNLAEFGLVSKSDIELTASSISGLSAGWTLISTPFAITDLSIFDNAKIIWIYNNASTSWSAYSSDATTKQKIIDNKSVNLITTIPAGSGIWVQK